MIFRLSYRTIDGQNRRKEQLIVITIDRIIEPSIFKTKEQAIFRTIYRLIEQSIFRMIHRTIDRTIEQSIVRAIQIMRAINI